MFERRHIFFISLFGLLVTVTFGVSLKKKMTPPCSTKACIDKAKDIQSKIDHTVNPCESFYDFACGNYLKQELSNNEFSRSPLDELSKTLMSHLSTALKQPVRSTDVKPVQDAKMFYQSCMKTDLVDKYSEQHLAQYINEEFGGWPILNPFNGNRNQGSHLSSIQLINRLAEHKVQPLILLFVANHPKNPNTRVIKLKQPQSLPPQILLNPQYQMAYQTYLKSFLAYFSPSTINVVNSDIANMIELTSRVSMATVNPSLSMKPGFKNMTIKQLQYYLPRFPWNEYIINGAFKMAGVRLTENDYITVEDWEYMTKFAELYSLYSNYNKKALDNFLIMSFINSVAIDYMPFKYLQLKQNFISLMTGVSQVQERDAYCSSNTNSILSFVTSRMYLDMFFDKNIKPKVSKMTDNIVSTFRESLDQMIWMDVHSRTLAKEKVDHTQTKVAYPEYLFNNTYLDGLYDFELNSEHYLKNGIKITRMLTLEAYQTLRKQRNRKEWLLPPTLVNPFYDRESNQIVLPAAVLNAPFYDENVPNYLNFGAIGSIIGHELTHGFDEAGRHFDKDGLFFTDYEGSLWSKETIHNYANRTECMIEQYNNYIDTEINMNINGLQTLNENIADNSGINQAFKAYEKWVQTNGEEPPLVTLETYTNEQMFFVSMAQLFCAKVRPEAKSMMVRADSHALARFRVLGSTSNSAAFSKSFNCKLGQANNPVKKCNIW